MNGNVQKEGSLPAFYTRLIFLVAILIVIVVIWKMISLQYIAGKEIDRDEYGLRTEILYPTRGNIYSQDGKLLATSMPFYELRLDCSIASDSLFVKSVDSLSRGLASLFKDKPAREYKKKLTEARKKGNRYMRIGNRNIGFMELENAKKLPLLREGQFKGGLRIIRRYERVFPYKDLAKRTIGGVNENGRSVGIEGKFNHYLEGKKGKRMIKYVYADHWIPSNTGENIPAVDGYDINTTINVDLQEIADAALRDRLMSNEMLMKGTVIVMEVETGAVRAIVNLQKDSDGNCRELETLTSEYTIDPGSTMKLSTLLCLLEDGHVTLDTPIDAGNGSWKYNSFTFRDTRSGGYGQLNVKRAFEKSSNIAFAKLAVQYYENDYEGYVARLHSLKINERLNLEIGEQKAGQLPSVEDMERDKTALPNTAIGYASRLSPFNIINLYNTVANGGKMMKPYLVESVTENNHVIEKFGPQKKGYICSEKTIKTATEALIGVVQEGTARSLNDPRYQIAGKTGTAQIAYEKLESSNAYKDSRGRRRYQASFAGFFPADHPKYSCIVTLYTGRTTQNFYGGTWAGPVFKKVADYLYSVDTDMSPALKRAGSLADLKIKRPSAVANEASGVPDVTHMGLKDALFILENQGYEVSFTGKGKVVRQLPDPNDSTVTDYRKIELTLSDKIE